MDDKSSDHSTSRESEAVRQSDRREFGKRRLSEIASLVAGIAAAVAATFASGALFRNTEPERSQLYATERIKFLEQQVTLLGVKVGGLHERLNALAKPDTATNIGTQIAALRSEVKTADSRMETLERGLLASPEKALSVPLLRNELENLTRTYRQDLDTTVKSIDRVYDQNKWFIGLMFTMAIGLIGLAISNFVQARRGDTRISPAKE